MVRLYLCGLLLLNGCNGVGGGGGSILNPKSHSTVAEAPRVILSPDNNSSENKEGQQHSLMGFDVSLDYESFRSRYSTQILKCEEETFTGENSLSKGLPIKYPECKLTGEGGFVSFYKKEIWFFEKNIKIEKVNLKIAADKLSIKVGIPYKVKTYRDGAIFFCQGIVPFFKGEAIVMSGIPAKSSQLFYDKTGEFPTHCHEEFFLEEKLERVRYFRPDIVKLMDAASFELRKAGEGKAANEFNL